MITLGVNYIDYIAKIKKKTDNMLDRIIKYSYICNEF